MELDLIEMVAYQAIHTTEDFPWRCMLCEKLTKHSHDDMLPHLVGAHNLIESSVFKDDGSMFVNSKGDNGPNNSNTVHTKTATGETTQ